MLDRRRTFEPGGISDFPERGSEALFVDMRANGVQHFALAVGQGGLVRLLLGGEGNGAHVRAPFVTSPA